MEIIHKSRAIKARTIFKPVPGTDTNPRTVSELRLVTVLSARPALGHTPRRRGLPAHERPRPGLTRTRAGVAPMTHTLRPHYPPDNGQQSPGDGEDDGRRRRRR